MSTFIATLREIACRVDDTPINILLGDLVESINKGTLLLAIVSGGLFLILDKTIQQVSKEFSKEFSSQINNIMRMAHSFVGGMSVSILFLLAVLVITSDLNTRLPVVRVRVSDIFIGGYFLIIILWEIEMIVSLVYNWRTMRRKFYPA
jgi:hypothetical protein